MSARREVRGATARTLRRFADQQEAQADAWAARDAAVALAAFLPRWQRVRFDVAAGIHVYHRTYCEIGPSLLIVDDPYARTVGHVGVVMSEEEARAAALARWDRIAMTGALRRDAAVVVMPPRHMMSHNAIAAAEEWQRQHNAIDVSPDDARLCFRITVPIKEEDDRG